MIGSNSGRPIVPSSDDIKVTVVNEVPNEVTTGNIVTIQEVKGEQSTRNKKKSYAIGIIILLAIASVGITLAVIYTGKGNNDEIENVTEGPTTIPPTTVEPSDDDELPIQLDDILTGQFSPKAFNGSWYSASEIIYPDNQGSYVIKDVTTNTERIIISNDDGSLSSANIYISPNKENILIARNIQSVYRHSFLAQYTCLNVNSYIEINIGPVGLESAFLQNVVWGSRGIDLAFVYENNVYYKASIDSEAIQLTFNGVDLVFYNGIPDWVYEEEKFSSHSTMWLSETHLAFATFNDENVGQMNIPTYGEPGSIDDQYTQHTPIRYPKSGTTNPTATVVLYNIESLESMEFTAPSTWNESILNSVQFTDNDNILIVWSNRVQNDVEFHLCNLSATCRLIYTYSEPDGWYKKFPIIFNSASNAFVSIFPSRSNGERWFQIFQISENTGTTLWAAQQRTFTANDKLNILEWSDNDSIWYSGTAEGDPGQRHLFVVDSTQSTSCFTCNILDSSGDACLYTQATIDETISSVVVECLGPNIPETFVYNVNGERMATWEDNSHLKTLTSYYNMPQRSYLSIPLHEGLSPAQVSLQLPHNVDSLNNIPLLVYVYGGPSAALFNKRWLLDWHASLVSRWGIAVARIDGRGSEQMSVDTLYSVNRVLGTLEIDDQISVTRYLQDNLPYIDASRSCIWGWSYGGYAASLALVHGGDTFKCGIAVAPVTDWHYYDTFYTERYMDTPTANPGGYLNSSLLTSEVAMQFGNKDYLLVHGTEDDNVHFQHSMLLSRLLQVNDIYFQQMTYVDEDHSITEVREHLYNLLETFLSEVLL